MTSISVQVQKTISVRSKRKPRAMSSTYSYWSWQKRLQGSWWSPLHL